MLPGAALAQPAPSQITMSIELGTPAALRVDARYVDPAALFPRLAGTLVFPLWVDVRNISSQAMPVTPQDLLLTLGSTAGAPVVLAPIDPVAAQRRLERDTAMSGVLRAIAGQGSRWARDPFDRHLEAATLQAGKSSSGYVFYERPAALPFDGFMTLGTAAHGSEVMSTGIIRNTPRTRSNLADTFLSVIARVPARVRNLVYGRPFDKSYALLFGISTYDDPSRNLKGPARDLEKMKEFLHQQGFDAVIAIADQQVTESALRNVQAHFGNRIRPNDRLLVYYAGHGQQNESGEADMLLSRGTRVPMRSFMSWIRSVNVKHLLVLLDACYSGTVIGGQPRDVFTPLDGALREKLYQLANAGSRYVITAGSARELANEDERWDGGLFTAAALRVLKSRRRLGLISTHELYAGLKDYVLDQVTAYNLTAQTPMIQDLGYGGDGKRPPPASEGEFVFVSGR